MSEESQDLKKAAESGGPLPSGVEEERARVLAEDSVPPGTKMICCKYYKGFGKWGYTRTSKTLCEKFPLNGEVVDDSKCKDSGSTSR